MSARQRRIADQAARIEAARRAPRRKLALGAGGIALVVLLVAGAAAWFLSRPAIVAQGHQVPIEGDRQHVALGADMLYRNRPPSSGDHYPTPAGYGVFTCVTSRVSVSFSKHTIARLRAGSGAL